LRASEKFLPAFGEDIERFLRGDVVHLGGLGATGAPHSRVCWRGKA
jgi:hypothetical protein